MADPANRYESQPLLRWTAPDGRVITYIEPRVLPEAAASASSFELVTAAGDRLDLLAARTLGEGRRFWRIADANEAMHPEELVAEPGTRLRIPSGRR